MKTSGNVKDLTPLYCSPIQPSPNLPGNFPLSFPWISMIQCITSCVTICILWSHAPSCKDLFIRCRWDKICTFAFLDDLTILWLRNKSVKETARISFMFQNKQSSLTWFCTVLQHEYAWFKVPVPVYTYVCVPVDNMVMNHWLEWCYMLLHVHLPLIVNGMYLCLTLFPQMVWFLLSGKTT